MLFFLIPKKLFYKLFKNSNNFNGKLLALFKIFLKILISIRENWPKLLLNKNSFPAFFVVCVSWVLSAISIELVLMSFYGYVPFLWVLTISVVSVLIGGLSQIPGGLGVRELTVVFLLTFLGVPYNVSIVLTFVQRLFTLFPIIIGYILLLGLNFKFDLNYFK